MPKVKVWSEDDLSNARQWVGRKAANMSLFRDIDSSDQLERIAATDDADLAEVLRELLTEKAWETMLKALRWHARQRRQRSAEAEPVEAPTPEIDATSWLKTTQGMLDVMQKVRAYVRAKGYTFPLPRSGDDHKPGTPAEYVFPAEGETYRDAVESPNAKLDDLINVSFTSIPDRSAGEEEETWEEPILGWVKGYRARVVVDPVWIPVDRKYQSRAEHYKPRKESPRKEARND